MYLEACFPFTEFLNHLWGVLDEFANKNMFTNEAYNFIITTKFCLILYFTSPLLLHVNYFLIVYVF